MQNPIPKLRQSSIHCVKSVGIRSYSGSCFPAFGLNTDQNNSEYGHFSRDDYFRETSLPLWKIENFDQLQLP